MGSGESKQRERSSSKENNQAKKAEESSGGANNAVQEQQQPAASDATAADNGAVSSAAGVEDKAKESEENAESDHRDENAEQKDDVKATTADGGEGEKLKKDDPSKDQVGDNVAATEEDGEAANGSSHCIDGQSTAADDRSNGTAKPRSLARSGPRRISFYDTVDAAEILPYLVVGNLASSKNEGFLKRKNIRFILNLTVETEDMADGTTIEGIEQLRVMMEDDEDEEILGHFQSCFDFIDKARAASSKKKAVPAVILVHSHYGLSRTSAIVLGYLMKEKQWSLKQAYAHLRKHRTSAKPNDGFVVQLLRYEQELHGTMSMTLRDFYQQP